MVRFGIGGSPAAWRATAMRCGPVAVQNIFAVATGIEEHNDYARSYIDATRRIKAELPHVHVSGGVSNLSFAFRGNEILLAVNGNEMRIPTLAEALTDDARVYVLGATFFVSTDGGKTFGPAQDLSKVLRPPGTTLGKLSGLPSTKNQVSLAAAGAVSRPL